MKAKFKYLGQFSLLILLGFFSLGMIFSCVIEYNSMELREQRFLVFGIPCLIILIIFVWKKIFTEVNQIEISDDKILMKNLFSRKIYICQKSELKGFKDKVSNQYIILLIDNNDKCVAKIYEQYYKNFNDLISNLEMEYLGREQSWSDKIF